ncbi:DUF21 domain-containing protein [Sedimentibacter sp.]|nr:DUF21 domain-containing protein [Sedimentibacter sp.]
MDDDVISQVTILILLILFSAVLSASEAAFVNFNKTRLKNISSNGNKNLVLELDDNYENLMSTILIVGTILKITAASLEIYILSNYLSVFLATAIAVLTILFFVEIPAKGLAKFSPEKHAVFLAPLLKLLVFLCTPGNFILTSLKSVFYKFFKTEVQPSMTED